ncbi:MAG: hypothetical protein ACPG4W_01250 [Flavobacteriales bacterium]
MITGLLHAHSGLSYLVTLLIVAVFIKSLSGLSNKSFGIKDLKLSLFALIATHIQLLLGLVLFSDKFSHLGSYMSAAAPRLRFVEHPVMMIVVAVLITIAHSKSKKSTDAAKTQKMRVILYGISILLIALRVLPLWMKTA